VKTPANSRGITVSAVNNSRYAENSNKALVNEHRSQLKIFNSRYKGKMSTAIRIESRVMPLTSDVDKDTQKVAKALSQVLANTFILSLKTQNFHWNVYGPMFHTLHLMFEEQYKELWLAGDALAERIRALGCSAPGSFRQFSKLSYLRESESIPTATGMIAELLSDHETCARTARSALSVARTAVDPASEDILTQRLLVHEKAAWMLHSLLTHERPSDSGSQ
jgi:starvation-inducible DNA-binding protein